MPQTMGMRAAPALRVSAGIGVGSCLLGAPHHVRVKEPEFAASPPCFCPGLRQDCVWMGTKVCLTRGRENRAH